MIKNETLESILKDALEEVNRCENKNSLRTIQSQCLGKRGPIAKAFSQLSSLPKNERVFYGKLLNSSKEKIIKALENKKTLLEAEESKVQCYADFDVTVPGLGLDLGTLHPITQVEKQIVSIFERMGFCVVEGPEIENEYYNFEALNIPKYHPARDMQDTFFLSGQEGFLLRTHTSPVQIRVMQTCDPPFQIIAPGKVYRRDLDPTHSPMFHQVEGLMIAEGTSFCDLKGTLDTFLKTFFGSDTRVRFRPSYFPFTEPSAEVDVSCIFCSGKGCRVCKDSGFLEVLGCGMVHPFVLRSCDIDPDFWQGFAFGIGVERLTMLKYKIDDIRLFFENNLRFLKQF